MNNIKNQFPHFYIKDTVKRVIGDLYGVIDWSPRVVRQNKGVENSTLDFIDYAIPCFDLSVKLKIKPEVIAKNIAKNINTYTNGKNKQRYFKAEAINGYVNFQLSDDYIADSIKMSVAWYEKPSPFFRMPKQVSIMVIGAGLNQIASLGTTDDALFYIQNLYATYSIKSRLEYLHSDYSKENIVAIKRVIYEKTDNYINKTLSSMASDNRVVRSFMAGNVEVSLNDIKISDIFIDIISNSISTLDVSLKNKGMLDYVIESEYELRDKISKYLNNLPIDKGFGFVGDNVTKAVFFLHGNEAIPLRSAEGIMYDYAFIMYSLESKIERCIADNTPLIIIGSHKLDLFVSEMFRYIIDQKESEVNVIYFDPRVSRADIVALTKTVPSSDILYYKVISSLTNSTERDNKNYYKRHALLKLIDGVMVLDNSLKDFQLPSLYDALNQVNDAVIELN
jgi:hypothetical protein